MTAFKKVRLRPGRVEVPSPLAPEARIDLKLDDGIRTGTVRGIVTDPSGNPVAGAMVQLAKNRIEPVAGCLTQPDGSFALSQIPVGAQYWLYAGRKGFDVFDSPPFFLLENQEIVRHIQLEPQRENHAACLAGRISVKDGRPATLSAVLVFRLADEVMHYHSLNFCDESGNYMVTNLEPGPYILRIIFESCPPVIQNLWIGKQDELVKLDFELA